MAAEDDPLQPLSWGQTTGGQPHPMEASTKDPGTSLVPRSSPSCGVLPSASSSQAQEWPLLKPVRRFAPPSAATAEADQVKPPLLTCSPEGAPLVHPWSGCPRRTAFAARECSSDGENESPPSDAAATPTLGRPPAAMDQGSRPTAPPSYEEKLEAYNQKYSYMKSWPGLLRLMGALELIFGGMVFACTAAYIQKDYQWPQLYGDFAGAGYGYGSFTCLKMWQREAIRKRLLSLVRPRPADDGCWTAPTGPLPFPAPSHCRGNYPSIGSMTEREKYKAVFNDLYAEYKELYREISAAEQKFQDLDAMMRQLPRHYQNRKEQSRLSAVRKEYRTKRKDPAYLEKQQRRDYLKRKLAHLKAQIQAYDWEAGEGSVAF
uniref:OCEL domain-containing protein n=1 Tax=Varanus komodoensis TaxID=61221 RepID=A0A8D2LMF0_VARKO